MLLYIKYLILLVAILCFVPAIAFSEVTMVNFSEDYTDKVPVAGSISVGAMVNVDNSTIDSQFMTLLMPETQSPKLCMSITSIDGRYKANYEYNIKNQKNELILLPTKTKHGSKLKKLRENQVAILATLNKTCKDIPDKVIFASWKRNVTAGNLNKYYVYLNWDNNVSIVSSDGKTELANCKKITDNSIAYNYECVLDRQPQGSGGFAINRFSSSNQKLQLIPLPLFFQ
ncbi:MAG: hypothetical protein H7844_13655 [Nitrospirae bacterium YQR-1]